MPMPYKISWQEDMQKDFGFSDLKKIYKRHSWVNSHLRKSKSRDLGDEMRKSSSVQEIESSEFSVSEALKRRQRCGKM